MRIIDQPSDSQDPEEPERPGGFVIGPTSGGPDVQFVPGHQEHADLSPAIDERMRKAIVDRIQASSLAGEAITLVVTADEARRTGDVTGPDARRLAGHVAESVAGVRTVRNDLIVKTSGRRRPRPAA